MVTPSSLLRSIIKQKPPSDTSSMPDVVSASSLGKCDTNAALKKIRYPETNNISDMFGATSFQGNVVGEAIAKLFTESFCKEGLSSTNPQGTSERALIAEINGVKIGGYADFVLEEQDEVAVVEIKTREGMVKRSVGDVRLTDLYQIASYMQAIEKKTIGYIYIASRWAHVVYTVTKTPHKASEKLGDATNYQYKIVAFTQYSYLLDQVYSQDPVMPMSVTTEDLHGMAVEIQKKKELYEGVVSRGEIVINDNPYGLNHENTWMCVKIDNGALTGKNPRPATVVPACPFASVCYPGKFKPQERTIIKREMRGEKDNRYSYYEWAETTETIPLDEEE